METVSKPERGHAALRAGRRSEAGRIYLVTFATASRERFFSDWTLASAVARSSRYSPIWRSSRLLCWVLMPDHWHGLIELGNLDGLSALVNRLKGHTARAVNATCGLHGHVWSKGFHDHALRADEALIATARYIVCNPVRAGLVQRVGMYPFWDAVWLGGAEGGSGQDSPNS